MAVIGFNMFDTAHTARSGLRLSPAAPEHSVGYSSNDEMELAWRIATETSANLFLTGKAGTGKTTLLRRLREWGRAGNTDGKPHAGKRCVVLAPTGIAAVNAGGVTIHSFFQLSTSPFIAGVPLRSDGNKHFDRFSRDKLRLIRSMELLIIDEVSMVRADLLDAVDDALRRHRDRTRPFGGVQVILVGDLLQLPPVVPDEERPILEHVYDSPYFFSSKAYKEGNFVTVELKQTYRQTDDGFLEILNSVRENRLTSEMLARLNSRVCPSFRPPSGSNFIRIVTHNHQASDINQLELGMLPSPAAIYDAAVKGNFAESSFPAERGLCLKPGAQVMFLRNDSEHKFYNGMLGVVVETRGRSVVVRSSQGENIVVEPSEWQNVRYVFDESSSTIEEKVEGTFRQLPLRLAWAITVHKSQGLTFDNAVIDVSHAFAHGQTYVALSRCRTLGGIVLNSPVTPETVRCDPAVVRFMRESRMASLDALAAMRRIYRNELIAEIFDSIRISGIFNRVYRVVADGLSSTRAPLVSEYGEVSRGLAALDEVSRRFASLRAGMDDNTLAARLKSAAPYFCDALRPAAELLGRTPRTCPNAAISKRLAAALDDAVRIVAIRRHILANIGDSVLEPSAYLFRRRQAEAVVDARGTSKIKKMKPRKADVDLENVLNPGLMDALTEWRSFEMNRRGVPAYCIAATKALVAVANACPRTEAQLMLLPGWGHANTKQYGRAILDIVGQYLDNADTGK